MKKRLISLRFCFLIFFVIVYGGLKAQYFLNGQNPAYIKWKQLNTDYFQVIFPKGYDSIAQYYVNLMSLTKPFVSEDYQPKPRKVSIILHNRTTTSNAMVPIAPMRMEFFEMPPQSSYPQIWQNQLALHEYRHVVQENKMRQGMTKVLFYIFGEQAIAGIFGTFVPFWFIEGDAVVSETMFSNSGRGRTPDFIYPLKAQVLDKKIYKYDKAVFGSFKDFIPDHYTLGYQLVACGNLKFGIDMWDRTLNQVARRPYYIMPFNNSLRRETGSGKVNYYNSILDSLKTQWQIEDRKDIDTTIEILSKTQRFFTNYLFPNALENGNLIAEKTSLDDINRFVLVDEKGKEKRIFTPGFDFEESLSVSDSLICWNEKGFDPRWAMRNYSVIKIYDLKQGKLRKLTSKSRYFAPALSSDSKKIVTVFISEENKYALHILDSETGNIIKMISTPDNLFFMTPHWSINDEYIVAMVLGKRGKSMMLIDTRTWSKEYILPFSFTEIKWPVMQGEWIVYTAAYEGKDNLYAFNINTKSVIKVFESRFGATNVSFSKNQPQLNFSYYTADGFKLGRINFNPELLPAFDITRKHFSFMADQMVTPATFILDDTIVPSEVFQEKKYSKAANLFLIHSWAPLAIDADNYSANPGVTILSQNLLSTTVATASYFYDLNEGTNNVKFGIDYMDWYPVISLAVDYGGRLAYHENNGETDQIRWKETNLSLNISVPLNFTGSKWIKGINPSVGISQKFLKMKEDSKYEFNEDRFTLPNYRFYAYNQLKRSPKDIFPKWGQSIDLIYRHTIFSDSANNQYALTGWLYLPGIIRHQGFKLYGGYQNSVEQNYNFSNLVSLPRGYTGINYSDFFSLRSDYAFPIAYPDLNVPLAFYLKRLYAHVFYDYLKGQTGENWQELSSTGAELYTDWHFISTLLQVTLGVRATYRFYYENMQYEFLFGISY